jgi:hypothetical protein
MVRPSCLSPRNAAAYYRCGLQLAWGEMLLPTNHENHIFNDSVVERFPRRVVDGMRKVEIGDYGADVLFNLCDLHRLGRNP